VYSRQALQEQHSRKRPPAYLFRFHEKRLVSPSLRGEHSASSAKAAAKARLAPPAA
jgi:hypothetical protein